MKGEVFHFRKEKVKDNEGNEIGEAKKHPSVTIPLPVPTKDEILTIFNSAERASEQKFILDQVYDAFYLQAREQINAFREDNKDATVSANVVDYSKLTITALANMPAGERGSRVSDEDLKAFIADYTAVMPEASGKDAKKIKAQADLLEKGLRSVRTDKKVLGIMQQLLAVYATATQNMEEHQEAYDMFTGRITKWLTAEPKNVLESIM